MLRAGDIGLVESMLRRANSWAHVDWLAVTVAGDLARRFAGPRKRLAKWAKHEWIRKAIGSVLREVAKKRPELTAQFVVTHGDRMSGLSKREALEHFSAAQRARLGR